MADTAISNLSAGAAVSATDVLPNVQTAGVGPVKTTAAQLKTFMSASPTLVTPTIGVATATSVNKVALTAPATGSTLTIADGKTLTANNTLTLAGTDGTTLTGPASSTTLAGLAIANVFTKAQTFQPDSDAQAGTFRRNGAAQTSNVVEIQTEANGFLAGFDKAGILTLGAASTQTGTLKLAGTTSGVVTLSTADAAGTWTMKLPTGAGTADYVLRTDGSGNTSWTAQTGGGGTPAGASLTLQYNNASSFGGMSGTSWDDTNRSLTMTGATVTANNPILNLTQTWNSGAVTFNGIKLNITDTSSAAASTLLELGTGGGSYVSQFSVDKLGRVIVKDPTWNNLSGGGGLVGSGGAILGLVSTYQVNFAQSNGTLRTFISLDQNGYLTVDPGMSIGWASTAGQAYNGNDAMFTRAAAATIQMGAADVDTFAACVAQTFEAQSVKAGGTSDQNGRPWTFIGSRGKGTGVGGSIILQTTPAGGTTGTTVNTPVTRLTITGPGNTVQGIGSALATTATDGFMHIATCAGTPTGVPTLFTGSVPMVFDTTGVKLWIYTGGAWKGVVVA